MVTLEPLSSRSGNVSNLGCTCAVGWVRALVLLCMEIKSPVERDVKPQLWPTFYIETSQFTIM